MTSESEFGKIAEHLKNGARQARFACHAKALSQRCVGGKMWVLTSECEFGKLAERLKNGARQARFACYAEALSRRCGGGKNWRLTSESEFAKIAERLKMAQGKDGSHVTLKRYRSDALVEKSSG